MDRFYRATFEGKDLVYYRVKYKQTDLFIASDSDYSEVVLKLVQNLWASLEAYIKVCPDFLSSYKPIKEEKGCPKIALDMIQTSKMCNVGPMAAVAGAISQAIGEYLRFTNKNVIVENGGDVYMMSDEKRIVSIYAVNNTINQSLKVEVKKSDFPMCVCTSSATYGPSKSFGRADSVSVFSKSGALADAAATSLCNMVKSEKDISRVLEFGSLIKGVSGIVIVLNKKIGAWGNVKFV